MVYVYEKKSHDVLFAFTGISAWEPRKEKIKIFSIKIQNVAELSHYQNTNKNYLKNR